MNTLCHSGFLIFGIISVAYTLSNKLLYKHTKRIPQERINNIGDVRTRNSVVCLRNVHTSSAILTG